MGEVLPNGWTVLTDSVKGRRDFRCPLCGEVCNMLSGNARHRFSCGCVQKQSLGAVWVRKKGRAPVDPESFRPLVAEAIAAFRSDFRYGEQIAMDGSKLLERQKRSSSRL